MRLKANAINRGPSGQKIPNELLEHREPTIAVHQDTIVIDKQPVVWKGTPDVFMNFSPDVRIARLVHVESVVCDALLQRMNYLINFFLFALSADLIDHFIDHVPVPHPDLVEVDHRLVNVLVYSLLKFLQTKFSMN